MRPVARRLVTASVVLALAGCGSASTVSQEDPTPSPTTSPTGTARGLGDRIGVRLPMEDWHSINGTMDSVSSVGYEGGEISSAGKADVVRDAGGKQAVKPGTDQWYPDAAVVEFVLSRAQWVWIADQLEHWASVADSVDQPEDAAHERRIAATIRATVKARPVGATPTAGPTRTQRHRGLSDDHELYLTPYDAGDSPYTDIDTSELHVLHLTPGATSDVLTLLTGRTYAVVDLTVRMLPRPSTSLADAMADGDWEVGEEATMRLSEPLVGLGSVGWQAEDVIVPGTPGLYRVRVMAKDRLHDDHAHYAEWPDGPEGRETERFDVTVWPVTERQPVQLEGYDITNVRPDEQPDDPFADELPALRGREE